MEKQYNSNFKVGADKQQIGKPKSEHDRIT
jgi:hypothetical protein